MLVGLVRLEHSALDPKDEDIAGRPHLMFLIEGREKVMLLHTNIHVPRCHQSCSIYA